MFDRARKAKSSKKCGIMEMNCPVCGSSELAMKKVLWPELIAEWELSPEEVSYVDEQQGLHCVACGSNLRSMTLASAIMRAFGYAGLFTDFTTRSELSGSRRILEINVAGTLTPHLSRCRQYTFARFPDVDMQAMNGIQDCSYDLVVHSDTLEHVAEPLRALRECYRVLKYGGVLAYTIPIIVGRLSRRRDQLRASFHGDPLSAAEDLRVVTEYGADFWCELMAAGFREISLHALRFPQSIGIIARRPEPCPT